MRRLIVVSLLLAVAVASTACLGQLFPGSSPEQEQTPSAPTATAEQAAQAQATNTPAPTTIPTSPPEATIAPAEETESGETASEEAGSQEAASEEATSGETAAEEVSSSQGTVDIIDVVWQWTELYDAEGQSFIADPENYVLIFYADGTFNIVADCNTGHGTYTLEGNQLTLGPIAITKMLCPKGSRSDQYVQLLGESDTVAIDPDSGNLIITLKDDLGQMVFAGAGTPKMPTDPCAWVPDVTWKWERFDDQAGENDIVVGDPDKYTLQLLRDGTFQFEADCNVGSGSYTCSDDGTLILDLGPTTLAECGPDSLYDEYLGMLDDVVSFVLDEGKLVLNLMADAGNLVFGR